MKKWWGVLAVTLIAGASFLAGSVTAYYRIFPHSGVTRLIRYIDPLDPSIANPSFVPLSAIFREKPLAGKVTFVGDSNVAFGSWAQLLLRSSIDNHGIAGDTTRGIIRRLRNGEQLGERVVVLIGTNDPSANISIDETKSNLVEIVKLVGARRLTMVAPMMTAFLNRNKPFVDIGKFEQEHCQKQGCGFIDLNQVVAKDQTLRPEYTSDGVHLNWRGYQAIARLLQADLIANQAVVK